MIREMLNAHAMNILLSEDVNEPSLRVRPHRKNRWEHRRACQALHFTLSANLAYLCKPLKRMQTKEWMVSIFWG